MILPSEEQIKAGEDVAGEMMDAGIEHGNSSLGGCRKFNIDNYKYKEIIQAYIKNEIQSVTGIWIAMQEAGKDKTQ